MGEGYDSKMGSTAQLGWEAAVLDSYWTAEEGCNFHPKAVAR